MIPLRPMGNRIYRLYREKDPHTGKTKGKNMITETETAFLAVVRAF